MKVSGIIAEFNPFHNGHKYIVDSAKKTSDCIIAIISGNYVERGTPAYFSKFIRAKAAIENGVDLVIELPSPWSTSFAQNFAIGGVSLLKELKVDNIVFGCESDELNKLEKIAANDNFVFDKDFKGTYASARQQAIETNLGKEYSILLETPNNNLAIEYIKAAKFLRFDTKFIAIKRLGVGHDDDIVTDNIASASKTREMLQNGENIDSFVPDSANKIYTTALENKEYLSEEKFNNAVISQLRRFNNFKELPELSEGIENRLEKAILKASNYNELLDLIKTKRYTLARVRRLVLNAFLGIDSSWLHKEVPYINVLGFSKTGEKYLKEVSDSLSKPLIFSMKPNIPLDKEAELLLNKECERNDIYMSLLQTAQPCKSDYTHKLIKRMD